MDFGSNIREFGPVNLFDLEDLLPSKGDAFWEGHRETRERLAGNRPGNAVFLINDAPASCPRRNLIEEAQRGAINVVHYLMIPFSELSRKLSKRRCSHF